MVYMTTAPLTIELRFKLGVDRARAEELAKELVSYIEDMDTGGDTKTDVVSTRVEDGHGAADLVIVTRGLGPGEDTDLADALEARLENGCAWGDGSDAVMVFMVSTKNVRPNLQLVR